MFIESPLVWKYPRPGWLAKIPPGFAPLIPVCVGVRVVGRVRAYKSSVALVVPLLSWYARESEKDVSRDVMRDVNVRTRLVE